MILSCLALTWTNKVGQRSNKKAGRDLFWKNHCFNICLPFFAADLRNCCRILLFLSWCTSRHFLLGFPANFGHCGTLFIVSVRSTRAGQWWATRSSNVLVLYMMHPKRRWHHCLHHWCQSRKDVVHPSILWHIAGFFGERSSSAWLRRPQNNLSGLLDNSNLHTQKVTYVWDSIW